MEPWLLEFSNNWRTEEEETQEFALIPYEEFQN